MRRRLTTAGLLNSAIPHQRRASSSMASETSAAEAFRATHPSRNAADLARYLEEHHDVMTEILSKLSGPRRRYVLVAASAAEWYGPGIAHPRHEPTTLTEAEQPSSCCGHDAAETTHRATIGTGQHSAIDKNEAATDDELRIRSGETGLSGSSPSLNEPLSTVPPVSPTDLDPAAAAGASPPCFRTIRGVLHSVDRDKDAKISEEEYREYIAAHSAARPPDRTDHGNEEEQNSEITKKTARTDTERCPTQRSPQEKRDLWRAILLLGLTSAAPFVAFGFLDNFFMIVTGGAMESLFLHHPSFDAAGDSLLHDDSDIATITHKQQLLAAGLGGVCSGVIGIQVHGLAGRLVTQLLRGGGKGNTGKVHRHSPALGSEATQRIRHVGGTFGICLGLLLGMTPLAFF